MRRAHCCSAATLCRRVGAPLSPSCHTATSTESEAGGTAPNLRQRPIGRSGRGASLPASRHSWTLARTPTLRSKKKIIVAMANTEGGGSSLDTLIVALNQACDGQEKRWYVSTLELQLVSLELCGACRSAQLLHVFVREDTPPTLWSSRTSRTTPSQRSPEVCTSNRVPAVQALCWTWALPMDRLPQRAAAEPQPVTERRLQDGHSFAASVESVVWPESLKRLVFSRRMPGKAVWWSTIT
ncbi:expressed unknown protein [Ectocarpus siliculosus]|uniref:Uncharacterized protein n=1 Tax=Ectocarpus siliculosus TaxID=2880 RepID=D7FTK8_ECTSI|nr:expressed unknown protein [Ectocarpus siliculosus]|eukprot:CBJ31399.1 expressed unknown protein [Ectocarpus siliculosus]